MGLVESLRIQEPPSAGKQGLKYPKLPGYSVQLEVRDILRDLII